MTLPEVITKCVNSRRACLWRTKGRRTDDNYAASIAKLERFTETFPKGGEVAINAYLSSGLHQHLLRVTPGNKAGRSLIEQVEQITQAAK